MKIFLAAFSTLILSLSISACGQKGPLYFPEQAPQPVEVKVEAEQADRQKISTPANEQE